MTRETTVRIGQNKIQIVLPEGFYRVLSGAIKPGDRYLNAANFLSTQKKEWIELSQCDVMEIFSTRRKNRAYDQAHWYYCLIRRGVPVSALPRSSVCPASRATGFVASAAIMPSHGRKKSRDFQKGRENDRDRKLLRCRRRPSAPG